MKVRGDSRKYDEGKSAMDLVPLDAVEAAGYVLTYGAAKYAPDSWQALEDRNYRYLGAMLRHAKDVQAGELYDSESGLLHVAHMLCNALFLTWSTLQEHGIMEQSYEEWIELLKLRGSESRTPKEEKDADSTDS